MKPRGFSRIKKVKKSYSSKLTSAHMKNLGKRSGVKQVLHKKNPNGKR